MRLSDILGRLAVANEKASEAQAVEMHQFLREHEAIETKTKAEGQERIYKQAAGAKRQVGAKKEAGALAKKRREHEQASREQPIREAQRTEEEKKRQAEQKRKQKVSEVGPPRQPSTTTPSFVLAREGAPGSVSTAPLIALGALGRAGGKLGAKGSVNASGKAGNGWGSQSLKLKALEARLWAHCEGILHDVWDPNTSRGQLRVQFENLFSVRDQVVLDALEARREEHCEGLRQDVFDANISGQQLRVKFEDLLSVKGQLDAQHL